jgi:hypothetical protein
VLSADDVIDFVRERGIIFVKQAVFTPEIRSPHNVGAELS